MIFNYRTYKAAFTTVMCDIIMYNIVLIIIF